jgi:erythromycin esterase-like protein
MRRHNAEPENQRKGPQVRFTGFDVQIPDIAAETVSRFVEKADPAYAPFAHEAARAATSAGRRRGRDFGVATGSFPVERARSRKLVYRGWIKTEDLRDGYAALWWNCYVGRESRGFDDMRDRAPRGTTDWQRFEITMAVPAETTNIQFGVIMPGRGKAWFDGLEILLDGEPVVNPSFDLDFEGGRLKGFFTPSEGYRVTLDRAVAKTGRQSLRIQGAPSLAGGRTGPAKAAEAWQAIVTRLEQMREQYSKEQDPLSVDWAVVNARLVKDSMDVRANRGWSLAVRDRAMARMVGWLLEQSPKARVVLWAHNEHVQRQAGSMGRFLEEQFPGQMVVLGFATGKGSYQAWSRRSLATHGLEDPPPDSFESVFQAAGLPRFILDLRKAVPSSPESGWLLERRRFRSIGAMEMSEQFFPLGIRDSFDGLVWIEKTSAALPLGR